jgi:hypothetical protein
MIKLSVVVAVEPEVRPLGLSGDLEANLEILDNLGYDGVEPFVEEPRKLDEQRIKDLVKGCGFGISGMTLSLPVPSQRR